MITEIIAKEFKGLTFNQPVQPKTLFLGPMGVGKSARTQALTLALLGYVPGASKENAEILKTFGSADVVSVGFVLDGATLERAWGKTSSGSVKEAFKLNGTRLTKDEYISAIGVKGLPKILDLSLFLALSDQKKIDFLLALYPGETNLAELDRLIENQKATIKAGEDRARTLEKSSAIITASRTELLVPVGSLAETKAEIEKTEKELATANGELTRINEANVKEQTTKEVKKEAAQEIRTVKQEAKKEVAAVKQEAQKEIEKVKETASSSFQEWSTEGFKAILQSILDTMEAAGCDVCAAKMVIKKELKKIK
jgi:hypothetical protein